MFFAAADTVNVAAVPFHDEDGRAEGGDEHRPIGMQDHPAGDRKERGGDDGAEREVAGPGDEEDEEEHHGEKRHGREIRERADETRDRDRVSARLVSLWTDFYIALGEPLGDDRWSFRLYTKPFVRFIWLGGILMSMGLLAKVLMLRSKRSTRQRSALNLINIVKEI